MNVQSISRKFGILYGIVVVRKYIAFLRRRAKTFELTYHGLEHLSPIRDKPFLVVANHVSIDRNELWPTAYVRMLIHYRRPADTFTLLRVIDDQTKHGTHVISSSGYFDRSKLKLLDWWERNVDNVVYKAVLENLPGTIPIEWRPIAAQRGILKVIGDVIARGDSILIFPQEKNHWEGIRSTSDIGSLAAYVATKFDLPIVPACTGNTYTWKAGNAVTVAFGEPFSPKDMKRENVNAEIYSRVNALVVAYAKRRFVFLSHGSKSWSESDELWCETALSLSRCGHQVTVVKVFVDSAHRRIKELISAGIQVLDYNYDPTPAVVHYARSLVPARYRPVQKVDPRFARLCVRLRNLNPQMVIVSQNGNFDGLSLVGACLECGLPYVLISQNASSLDWPIDSTLPVMELAYREAKRVYFVAQQHRELTELQVGYSIPNYEIVSNPIRYPIESVLPWPNDDDGVYRLACVADYNVRENGQDIVLRVLAQEKWMRRPIEVSFYGEGDQAASLQKAAAQLKLQRVNFHNSSVEQVEIWQRHHLAVFPSRAQGPCSTLSEAMYCGRPVIVTAAAGNDELVDDRVTGFVSMGSDLADLDFVLERAWQQRECWESMGLEAAKRIRRTGSHEAGEILASKIEVG